MNKFRFVNLTLIGILLSLGFNLSQAATVVSKADEDLFPLAIIHINDFHARFEETNLMSNTCKPGEKCIGGYARTVTVVKQLKEKLKDKNPIYLNAGDSFQGTLWYNFLKWNVVSHFLNLLKADAMTIGNHEFDDGIAGVVPFLEDIQSPMIVANIDSSDEPTFQGHYNHSLVIDKNGTKIGIIGVVLQSYDVLSKTEKLKFLDEVETVKAEAEKLNEAGVKIIIVLSHSGLEMDRKIAKEGGPLIDVIVGGHSHTFLYTGPPPGEDIPVDVYPVVEEQPDGRKVYIVQASAFTKYVGELTAWFDQAGNIVRTEGNPIYLSNDIIPDPEIMEELKPYKEQVDAIGNKVHGESRVLLEKPPCVRGECSLGNFVTDSYVDHFIPLAGDGEWTYSSIAVQNAGGVRTSLSKGNLTYADLIAVLPFENELAVFELRGDKLLQALEYSVSKEGTTQSNMLQVSGMRNVFNFKNPPGERVESVHILCRKCKIPTYEPLNLFEDYRIAMPSFLADGGDGFSMFKEFGKNKKLGGVDIEIFTNYVERKSPIFASNEGRIKILQ
uniref:apyrase n=1 Tax=Culicoides sonorensis TaxID=179676 RepID=A0A336KUY8_CULSO